MRREASLGPFAPAQRSAPSSSFTRTISNNNQLSMKVLLAALLVPRAFGLGPGPEGDTVVLRASNNWFGADGPWSTFQFKIGSPPQDVQLLPSPYRSAVAVITPDGCLNSTGLTNCDSSRGNTYDFSKSTSWVTTDAQGWSTFDIMTLPLIPPSDGGYRNGSRNGTRDNPGGGGGPSHNFARSLDGSNTYGTDSLSSGRGMRQFGISQQAIVGISSAAPFLGLFGLSTSFNGTPRSPISFFDNVRATTGVQSASWSYTAGSVALDTPGSLILGGYDASRFDPSTTLTTSMTQGNRTFTLLLGDITVNTDSDTNSSTNIPKQIVDLDFTTPFISLPIEICRSLERSLGISYDNQMKLYTINATTHESLLALNPKLTISLFDGSNRRHDFALTYKSLALTAAPPLVHQSTHYFPLVRSRSQFYLGRAFLQETYLTAVFDSPSGGFFNLSQATYIKNTRESIMPILPGGSLGQAKGSPGHSSSVKSKVVPGVVVGVLALVSISAYLIWAWNKARFPFAYRKKRPDYAQTSTHDPEGRHELAKYAGEPNGDFAEDSKANPVFEVEGDTGAHEIPGPPRPPTELMGDTSHEIDVKPKKKGDILA